MMKQFLYFVFLVGILMGCRKEPVKITNQEGVYEDWKVLPDSIIRYGFRNITATEKIGNKLYVQAKNAHYMLDSVLISNKYEFKIFYWDIATKYALTENIKHNDNYIIYPEHKEMLTILDAKHITTDEFNKYLHVPSLVEDYGNVLQCCFNWSNITDDNEFDVVVLEYEADTAIYWLINFKIIHTSGSFQKIQVQEQSRFIIKKAEDNRQSGETKRVKVWRLGGLRFVYIAGSGELFRFSGNTLLDVNKYGISNIFEHDNKLYAGSLAIYYLNDSLRREDGLISSSDNGASWDYVGYGQDIASNNIKSIGGYMVLYHIRAIGIMDINSGKVKKADLTGLNAQINSIEKFHDKVVVGTDAGVYYKSWKSFLNK